MKYRRQCVLYLKGVSKISIFKTLRSQAKLLPKFDDAFSVFSKTIKNRGHFALNSKLMIKKGHQLQNAENVLKFTDFLKISLVFRINLGENYDN